MRNASKMFLPMVDWRLNFECTKIGRSFGFIVLRGIITTISMRNIGGTCGKWRCAVVLTALPCAIAFVQVDD